MFHFIHNRKFVNLMSLKHEMKYSCEIDFMQYVSRKTKRSHPGPLISFH